MSVSNSELNDLFRYALSLAQKREDAFDLLQSALEKMMMRERDVHVKNKVPYLKTSIRHLFFNLKSLKFSSHDSIEDDHIRPLVDDGLEGIVVAKDQVKWILEQCSPKEREMLFLWAYEGMSYSEISIMMETPKGTLLSMMSRIKHRVQKRSEREGHYEF